MLDLVVGVRTSVLVLAVFAAAYLGTVPVLSTMAAAELSFGAASSRTATVRSLVPGDWWSEELWVQNVCSEPLAYRLSFATQGDLWSCDPGPSNLTYQVTWGGDVDWRLEPGEVEKATVVLRFPLAVGNECQGRSGSLLVYRGLVQAVSRESSHKCCRVFFVPRGGKLRNEGSLSGGL